MNGGKDYAKPSPPPRTCSYSTTELSDTPTSPPAIPIYSNFTPNARKSLADLTSMMLSHSSRTSSRLSIDNSSIYATSDYVSYSSTDYQSSTDGGGNIGASPVPKKSSESGPCRPSRRKSRRNTQVIRPNVPPPAPPKPPPLPSDPPPSITPPASPTPPKLPLSPPPLLESILAETLNGGERIFGRMADDSAVESGLEGTYAYHLINSGKNLILVSYNNCFC